MILQPAYTITYIDAENLPKSPPLEFHGGAKVLVSSYSLDGKQHFGKPKSMPYENLPLFLFQLVDAGYYIKPTEKQWTGIRSIDAFSPDFVTHHIVQQIMEKTDEHP